SNDEPIRALVAARSGSKRLVAPAVDRALLSANGRLRLTTTMRVVSGAHHDAAGVRLAAEAAVLARLAQLLVLVVRVADLTDGGAAIKMDHAHFARRQSKGGVAALLCHELCAAAGGADHLSAAARLH